MDAVDEPVAQAPLHADPIELPGRGRFIHISDVHFSRDNDSGKWDVDLQLRDGLIRDAEAACASGPADGIFVTGDIAATGAGVEFTEAGEWLDSLARSVGMPAQRVWTVPGNHDVDRAVVRELKSVRMAHDRLRTCGMQTLDEELRECLMDAHLGQELLLPLANYNEFADRYGCRISGIDPYWEADFRLSSARVLRLRGMSTVFVSDQSDNDAAHRLVLGSAQRRLDVHPELIYLTMAHHPPSWLRDGEVAGRELARTSSLQLWGHRHSFDTQVIDNRCLVVAAGSTQPPRSVDWEPRYNVLDIELEGDTLKTRLMARVWDPSGHRFVSDTAAPGGGEREDRLILRDLGTTTRLQSRDNMSSPGSAPVPDPAGAAPMDQDREFAYLFSTLSYDARIAVLEQVGVWPLDGEELFQSERDRLICALAIAKSRGLIGELRMAISQRHGRDHY